jgi:CDP-diacylglycerol---glycerol-3-phosphate 3-phosphatidyltransferase
VWLRPSADEDPVFTLIGSTNLSRRSAELDSELSFGVLTSSPSLRAALAEEVRVLREHAVPWQGETRKVRMGTKALVGLVGGML